MPATWVPCPPSERGVGVVDRRGVDACTRWPRRSRRSRSAGEDRRARRSRRPSCSASPASRRSSSANIGCVPSVPESTTATENPSPVSPSSVPSPSTSTAPSWTGRARVASWEVSVSSAYLLVGPVDPGHSRGGRQGGDLGRRTDSDGDADLVQAGLGHQPGSPRRCLGRLDAAAGLHHHADGGAGADLVEVRPERRLQDVTGRARRTGYRRAGRLAQPGLGRHGGEGQRGRAGSTQEETGPEPEPLPPSRGAHVHLGPRPELRPAVPHLARPRRRDTGGAVRRPGRLRRRDPVRQRVQPPAAPHRRRARPSSCADHDVRFVISLGDNIYQGEQGQVDDESGGEDDDWYSSFFQPYRYVISRVPVFPAIGNHDTTDTEGSDDRAQMEDNFHLRERFRDAAATARRSDPGLFYRLALRHATSSWSASTPPRTATTPDVPPVLPGARAPAVARATFAGGGRPAGGSPSPTTRSSAPGRPTTTTRRCSRPCCRCSTPPASGWSWPATSTTSRSPRSTAAPTSSPGPAARSAKRCPRASRTPTPPRGPPRPTCCSSRSTDEEARLTPVSGLLPDGSPHLMTALTPENEIVGPPWVVRR